jgi:hypothetical protein
MALCMLADLRAVALLVTGKGFQGFEGGYSTRLFPLHLQVSSSELQRTADEGSDGHRRVMAEYVQKDGKHP